MKSRRKQLKFIYVEFAEEAKTEVVRLVKRREEGHVLRRVAEEEVQRKTSMNTK